MITKAVQKARKSHRCDGCDRRKIKPGEPYLTHTALRGDEFGYQDYGNGRRPVRFKECVECATRYGRGSYFEAAS